ncbi:unnamed protein product [Zymoseptoria tritici ST99CH_1A5]|uniref:Uncharacterized protein n=1 Tax=Zymoseptoria tritici ST99CH_1A5 TaxID=1276529 RepID=A0A1Y6LNN3_ZYMTR|nr:unnamed protein product [Zymoseptoria tritici ST99CH_1A5]
MPNPTLLKTHFIIDEDNSTRHTEIRTVLLNRTSTPLFYICTRDGRHPLDRNTKIRTARPTRSGSKWGTHDPGPSVAGTRLWCDTEEIRAIAKSHPDERHRTTWTDVKNGRDWRVKHLVAAREFRWEVGGRGFLWRQTHRGNSTDYKLFDARERMLASYWGDRRGDRSGRMNFYAEMDEEEELMSLAVLWGIQEKAAIRREMDRAKTFVGGGYGYPYSSPYGGYGYAAYRHPGYGYGRYPYGGYGAGASTWDFARAGLAQGLARGVTHGIVDGYFRGGNDSKGYDYHSDYY